MSSRRLVGAYATKTKRPAVPRHVTESVAGVIECARCGARFVLPMLVANAVIVRERFRELHSRCKP